MNLLTKIVNHLTVARLDVLGGYLPSLSINYVGMNKDTEKKIISFGNAASSHSGLIPLKSAYKKRAIASLKKKISGIC